MFYLTFPEVLPVVPGDKKSRLFQLMAWCLSGNKPLPETMMTIQLTDAYIGGLDPKCPENSVQAFYVHHLFPV